MRGDAYRHLFRSRRLPVGAELRLVDGAGQARSGLVEHVGSKEARVGTGEALPNGEPNLHLHLLVAAPRFQRASWLVEKATELGVTTIRFLRTERDPRGYGDGNLERLRRVAVAALEQCQRSRLPTLSGVHDWHEVPALLTAVHEPRSVYRLDPGAPALAAPRVDSPPSAILLVGPEGGWSNDERAQLDQLGTQPRGLGSTVLRIETAALAGAAILLQPPREPFQAPGAAR